MTTATGAPNTTAVPVPVPAETRLALDESVRRFHDGTVLLGGSPLRLLRLRSEAAALLDRWVSGDAVGNDRRHGLLARRLLDAGLAHPLPNPGALTTRDVTLVVPVKDNPTGLARLLAATGDVPARIVVDDGSAAAPIQATVRHAAPAGPAAARNTGWRRAGTELVAFLDSDTVPEPGWLDAVLPLFTDPQVVAVAPRVVSADKGSNPARRALGSAQRGWAGGPPEWPNTQLTLPMEPAIAERAGLSTRHSRGVAGYEAARCPLDMGARPGPVRPMSRLSYVPSAALVVRRSALDEIGGFDEALRYGEDVDLVWRLIDTGGTVRYQPDALVRHGPRRTLQAWLRQRFDYGSSAAPLAHRHGGKLACARMSPWTAAAWALAAAGHPRAGAAVAATTAGVRVRELRRGLPVATSLRLAAAGQLAGGRQLTEATRRVWWPLALLTRRGRLVLLASLLPCLVETLAGRHGPRWAALRVADDLAYGAGVWVGCLRRRTFTPIRPQFTDWPGRNR